MDNTVQWDARLDWNITQKDTAYSRFSYWNEVGYRSPPLGSILDGGSFGDDGDEKIFGGNFMLSETHLFTPTLTNEFRGYNYMHTGFLQPNANNPNLAASIGMGGIPGGPYNGGLPQMQVSGISNFGSPGYAPTKEYENVYQFLDNVTKTLGKHTIKAGVNFQSIPLLHLAATGVARCVHLYRSIHQRAGRAEYRLWSCRLRHGQPVQRPTVEHREHAGLPLVLRCVRAG